MIRSFIISLANFERRKTIAEVVDKEEIIAAVQEAPEEEEGEDIGNQISNTVALDNIQNIFNDIKINNSLTLGMKNLRIRLEESKMHL